MPNQTLLTDLRRGRRINILRRTVQASFALFCLYAGYRFYLFYLWAAGRSETFVPRPPSVEAFLPIGALVNLKRLLLTGQFDPIHPAGLTIFLAALFRRLPAAPRAVVVPPGDDCAALDLGGGRWLLVAVDQVVGDRHYVQSGPAAISLIAS